ncbi:hypothetical protein PsorP6_003876 [Peronosclerospora sorghi]|uniref:Uncharacterized protein n=1 Tax=Peronosclerospora sorghi TaxID=230839 RepID=A0ACC0VQ93_9STRA|nr:hypothetical protein PsorP6_003876 [Peronosclerospora sorghi]
MGQSNPRTRWLAAPHPSYPGLEEHLPKAFTLLLNALRCTNTTMPTSEATSEIMALFGQQLVAFGELEQVENTLKNSICVALHCKNVLLQTRLLTAVFEHYINKGLVQA